VETLMRINHDSGLPQDAELVTKLLGINERRQQGSDWEPQCMLLDSSILQKLVGSVYCLENCWAIEVLWKLATKEPPSQASDTEPILVRRISPYMYAKNDLGRWLFNCEQFFLKSMIEVQNGDFNWQAFQREPKLLTLLNLLHNIGRYIHTKSDWNEDWKVDEWIEMHQAQ
jgi:hypothetical protein